MAGDQGALDRTSTPARSVEVARVRRDGNAERVALRGGGYRRRANTALIVALRATRPAGEPSDVPTPTSR